MPTWLLELGDSLAGVAIPVNANYYDALCGKLYPNNVEARGTITIRDTYTLANLWVRVAANTLTTAATTIRSRKNGGNGNQAVAVGAGLTGVFEDAVNTDGYVAGNTAATYISVANSGVGSISFSIISYTLTTSLNTVPIFITTKHDGSTVSLGANRYVAINGALYLNSSETNSKYTFRVGATLSNLQAYVSSNTQNAAAVVWVRKNGADGNETVTIPLSTTGLFEDAANTDVLVSGNEINYRVDNTAAGAGAMQMSFIHTKSNCASRHLITGDASSGITVACALTRHLTMEGDSAIFGTVELNSQGLARTNATLKNLFVRNSSNSINGASTLTVYQDGGPTAVTVSIGAATSGTFEDTVNSVAILAAELINYRLVTGGGAGSMYLHYAGVEEEQPSGGGYAPFNSNASKLVAAGVL